MTWRIHAMITRNKKPHSKSRAFIFIGKVFDGTPRLSKYYSSLIFPSRPLTRKAPRYVHSWDCSMETSKSIGRARSPVTPIRPTWTRKPAVINNGDKQHFLAWSLQQRGVLYPKESQNLKNFYKMRK